MWSALGRLAERLSPDELGELLGGCMTLMSQAVEEYGGLVQAYQGDSICAYFGVPVTREDDPERAARSALRIHEVVGAYARDIAAAWAIPDFAVRVGLNTGRVSIGRVGAGNPQLAAFGDAVQIASHLQAAAATRNDRRRRRDGATPCTAVHDRAAGRGAGGGANTSDRRVDGSSARVRLVRLRDPAPSSAARRDVARVRAVAADLDAGRGQTLLLLGEPGIGKTRMLAELRSATSDRALLARGSLSSYVTAVWPFVTMLRRWLGVEPGDAEIVVRTRARARLGTLFGGDPVRTLPGLARLMRMPASPAAEPADARGDYVAWITALMEQGPVVVALEDLHWAHVSTRELAEDLLALTDRGPLLLVATLRRDTASEGWRFRSRVLADFAHRSTEITLDPLPPAAAGEILATLLPGALDETTRDELVARAEGNPLYLEELLRALLEGGGLERRHRTWTTNLTPSSLLPPALENLLVARIDRLADGPRRLAQIAAVLGREFPVTVLEHVAGEGAGEDLAALLRAEIVRELRRYPELTARSGTGSCRRRRSRRSRPARRRELYAAVATAFEQLYAGALDDHLERLAHYQAQSGDAARGDRVPRACGDAGGRARRGRAGLRAPRGRAPSSRSTPTPDSLLARSRDVDAVERVKEEAAEALGDEGCG